MNKFVKYIKSNKNLSILGLVAIIAIILIVVFLFSNSEKKSENFSNNQNQNTNTPSTETQDNNSNPKVTGAPNNNVEVRPGYTEAVNLYVNKRIQFNENCLVTPNNLTFKTGTKIMFDNRSAKARTFSLDNVRYNLKAYDYTFVTLSTSLSLPHEIIVECGNGENNGKILLQK